MKTHEIKRNQVPNISIKSQTSRVGKNAKILKKDKKDVFFQKRRLFSCLFSKLSVFKNYRLVRLRENYSVEKKELIRTYTNNLFTILILVI